MARFCWRCKEPPADAGLFCARDGDRIVEKDPWTGKTVGGLYRLEGLIGAGGFGRVYVAVDEADDEIVAVKLLLRQGRTAAEWEKVREAQAREASIAEKIDHPHLILIHDYGEDEDTESLYAVMPLGGRDLRMILADEGPGASDYEPPYWLQRAASVAVEIGGALSALHGSGIYHRDVKPQNVLEVDGRMVLIDYNISKEMHDTVQSMSGVKGTPAYIAPDFWTASEGPKAKSFWESVDQYAFGVMMYELFRGRLPFTADGPQYHLVLAEKHKNARPPAIRPERPEVPEPIEAAILKMLEKNPAKRFKDLAEACEPFRRYAGAVRPKERPVTSPEPAPKNASGVELTGLEVETDPQTGERRWVLRF
ncbi:MAG: serine/threonine protein kinase [Elusimicrobia bacterium]|nr:serine/threonine protein kinase [Elusimicrobiota bacterium]